MSLQVAHLIGRDGVHRVADAGELAALVASSDDRLLLVDARYVGHLHPLRLAAADTRFPAVHVPGALAVEGPARAVLAALLDGDANAWVPAPDDLAEMLAGAGTALREAPLGDLVARVPGDDGDRVRAEALVASVDEEQVRLTSAVKARDGFFTTFFVSTWSRYLARWCARLGLTPNQVTVASLVVALAGAAGAATGTRAGYVGAALALYFSFVLDCTDGQLARYSVSYSRIGSWLDATFDRVKEYAVYAGLAFGAARSGDDVWTLAAVAMALQTVRHIVDFSFTETRLEGDEDDGAGARLSGRLNSVGWTVWARRMIILPIGERWALIALLTAFTRPRVTFVVLIAGCVFAACYTTAGRVLRSLPRAGRAEPAVADALLALTDSGPLAALRVRVPVLTRVPAPALALLGVVLVAGTSFGVHRGSWWALLVAAVYVLLAGQAIRRPLERRLDWLVPPLFRAAEYTVAIVLTARDIPRSAGLAFAVIAAVAYHHYDVVYRLRGGHGAPPRALTWAVGGHEGRVLLMVGLAAAGPAVLRGGLAVLATAVAVVVLAESIRFWSRDAAPDLDDAAGPAARARTAVGASAADPIADRTGDPA